MGELFCLSSSPASSAQAGALRSAPRRSLFVQEAIGVVFGAVNFQLHGFVMRGIGNYQVILTPHFLVIGNCRAGRAPARIDAVAMVAGLHSATTDAFSAMSG